MASGREHPAQVKAAVMAALMQGQSVHAIAEEYDLPRTTVISWKKAIQSENIIDGPQKRDELGELIITYVRENLETLAAQSRHARNSDWLTKQPASELAVLHGVIADKTLRILAALEPDDASVVEATTGTADGSV